MGWRAPRTVLLLLAQNQKRNADAAHQTTDAPSSKGLAARATMCGACEHGTQAVRCGWHHPRAPSLRHRRRNLHGRLALERITGVGSVNSASSACVVLGNDDARPPSVVSKPEGSASQVFVPPAGRLDPMGRWLAPVLLAGWRQKQKRCLTSIWVEMRHQFSYSLKSKLNCPRLLTSSSNCAAPDVCEGPNEIRYCYKRNSPNQLAHAL
jgi:hypothetical protein